MMAKKKYVLLSIVFMFLTSLAIVNVPVSSQPSTTFYVDQPLGYIPAKPAGTIFWVDILVNASDLIFDSPDAIVGWGLIVQVDPTVLKPLRVRTAAVGYFLFDFADYMWYDYPSAISKIDSATGLVDVTEQILPTPPGGAATDGVLPAPYLLVSIQFESLTIYDDTVIDVINPEYMDANGNWHAVTAGDGYYKGIEVTPVEANLVGRKAWPEHHKFDRSKDGDPEVYDRHGTPGYQTFYAKVKNTGEDDVTVRAVFRLMKDGEVEPAIVTSEVTIAPGEIITLSATARMFTEADDGKWSVVATCEYYNPYSLVWVPGATTKTFAFSVVA